MKCWKCGKDIPDGASVCTYCSAPTDRKAPVTEAGKAMRRIYDHFGCEAVLSKKSILAVALGDLLEDSKKLRNQVEMAMAAGVGNVYASQLRDGGKPDAAFSAKVCTLMIEEAGFSDRVAAELMGYFDEMIGWGATPFAANQHSAGAGWQSPYAELAKERARQAQERMRGSMNNADERKQQMDAAAKRAQERMRAAMSNEEVARKIEDVQKRIAAVKKANEEQQKLNEDVRKRNEEVHKRIEEVKKRMANSKKR